ncbi:MAG: carboxypeptidase regulatory-like domain-containing protein [Bryobacterales bacterium]|nr:carboxypeptidase regulatory-like domain-containing protein [Bryobacterales bacterium]
MCKRLGGSVLLSLLYVSSLAAQTGNASINGQVQDTSGAVIPGVAITAKNVQTNVTRTTQSNAEGRYSITNLIPGTYNLTAEFQGFKNLQREAIALRVGDSIGLDLVMEVGSATESVTVTGQVPLLRTEDVQAGLVIDNRRVQELPQYNRDPLAFTLLAPNVSGTSERAGDLRINGGRAQQIEYFVDGVPMTSGYDHTVPASLPGREALGEFKVLTNGLSAEYGRLSGGAVVLVTRSGTNELHGSAYEFFRNDKLNANDWNSNRFGRTKGVFHDNVFGGTIGGPVWIPKVYNGRDRTFFFLNYEGTRRATGSNAVLTGVPSMLERQGDFSQSLFDRGVPVKIFDPLTSVAEGTRVRRQPFAGNMIPQARFNPLSKIYLGYYPEPNRAPLAGSSHDGNFIGSVATPSSNDRWTGRLDQNWNSNHSTHGTVTRFDSVSSSPRWLSELQPVGLNWSSAYTVSVDHTWTLNPTTLLSFRAGVVRTVSFSGQEVDVDASSWPLQPQVINLLGTTRTRVPNIATGESIFNLGGGQVTSPHDTSYSGIVAAQKIWGRHTFKFGYEHRRYYSNLTLGGNFGLATDRRVTSEYYDNPVTGMPFAGWLLGFPSWGGGTQLAGPASRQTYHGVYFQDDIKLTRKLTVNAGIRWDYEPPRTERFNRQVVWDPNYKWDWQPNPGWSWDQVQREAGITFAQPEWLSKGLYGRAAMMGTAEYPMRTFQKDYKTHFGPRAGFAYQFMPRTVFRASYGLLFLTLTGDMNMNSARDNIGYGDQARMIQDGTSDGGLTYPVTFTVPLPGGSGYVPFTRDVTALNRSTMGNWFVTPAYNMYPGYEHAFQANLQRELGSGNNVWVVEAAYSGSMTRDLPLWTDKHVIPNSYHVLGETLGTNLNKQVSNPFYGQIPFGTTMGGQTNFLGRVLQRIELWREIVTLNEPQGYSNYHAGYFQVEHRFANGYGFLANYTLSKLLQTGSVLGFNQWNNSQAYSGLAQAGLPLSDIYGLAPFDVTHRVLFNYVADLPFGRGRKFLGSPDSLGGKVLDKFVGGWTVSGTTTYRGGMPFKLFCGGGYCRNWISIGQGRITRPRFVLPRIPYDNDVSGHQALEGAPGFKHYMEPSAFRVTQNMEIGDVGGSDLHGMRGPGFSQWDFALLKNIGLGKESRSLQVRFEFQNLFNHMNAGQPQATVPDRDFGMIVTQAGEPRKIMIAAKIFF